MTTTPTAVTLRQAAGRTLHDKIANTLGTAIVAGEYPPGSALPTDVELCGRLSVSRSALREAFKLLAAKRLIRSRQKVGTQVRPRVEWNMLDPEVLAWHVRGVPTDAFVSGLFEVRRVVEPEAAALAAQRRSPEQLARLEAALADMVRFQDHSGDLADADLRFHQAILDATGNFFLASLGAVIESALVSSFRLSWDGGAHTPDAAMRQHHEIVAAIREGRSAAAHAIMTELLGSAIEDVRTSLSRRRAEGAGQAA
jgi:DNA-binding FadR family transcriptional regulator